MRLPCVARLLIDRKPSGNGLGAARGRMVLAGIGELRGGRAEGQRGAAEKKAPARAAAESCGVLPDSIAAIAMSPR